MRVVIIAIFLFFSISCNKPKVSVPTTEPSVTKNIVFKISTQSNLLQYPNNTFAKIEMAISQYDRKSTVKTDVFDSLIDFKPIGQYYTDPFPLVVKMTIPNFLDSKSQLLVGFNISTEVRENGARNQSFSGHSYYERDGDLTDTLRIVL